MSLGGFDRYRTTIGGGWSDRTSGRGNLQIGTVLGFAIVVDIGLDHVDLLQRISVGILYGVNSEIMSGDLTSHDSNQTVFGA
jgi:hypothetical protein